ncbi:unnamed protein product [Oppiella nova]|uniref:TLC domain-containing protein n=1 Tax=Oppiella nova TaxID=334625 RepID=A0A7R9QYW3_9ACAR|nr:unnamed protein product [Oppiella nova]CAG2179201.1 unnamed protein product [Oppiella nova]
MVLIIFHHIVSLVLFFGSYMSRAHDVGIVMAFLHDINDIFLDCPKLCHALLVLPITWIVSRLYYFPLNAIYRALLNIPCTYSLIAVLYISMQLIMVTNVIWTVTITGKEIEDPVTESVEKNE